MDPITAAALISGGVSVAQGIAGGISRAASAKALRLTEEEEREKRRLERAIRAGEGLSARERGSMEARFLAEQAGAQRELEAAALQQAAARGAAGAVSGRDIFLQEQAQAQAETQMRQAQNIAVMEADRQALAEKRAQLDALRAQERQAEVARREGLATTATLGLLGAGAGTAAALAATGEAKEAAEAAEAVAAKTNDLATDYSKSQYSGGFRTYGFGMQPAPVGGQ